MKIGDQHCPVKRLFSNSIVWVHRISFTVVSSTLIPAIFVKGEASFTYTYEQHAGRKLC